MSVIRVFHLLGGARATWAKDSGPASVEFEPRLVSGTTLKFEGSSLGQVIQRCNQLGLQVFGLLSFTHKLELDGVIPPEWRTVHYQPHKTWLYYDAETTWSQIAYAVGKQRSGRLWDCAARIAYQMEACLRRMQQLSDGYFTQLVQCNI